jgi:hypothetical protein
VPGVGREPDSWRGEAKDKGGPYLIRVTAEIREGDLTYRVCVTAPSIEHARGIMREEKPGRRVCLVFPLDPEVFFVPEESGAREEAA